MKIDEGQYSPTILIEQGTARIRLWSNDLQDFTGIDDNWLTIQGEAAYWLFMAVTGHAMHEPGCEARPFKARAARAHIEARHRYPWHRWGVIDFDEKEYWMRARTGVR